jgi:hypothetical protein
MVCLSSVVRVGLERGSFGQAALLLTVRRCDTFLGQAVRRRGKKSKGSPKRKL